MGLFSSDDVERDAKYVIVDAPNKGNGEKVRVTIPTQSDEKDISQAGWSVGGFVERTSSSGTVVDEPKEAVCTVFLVRDYEIEIGLRPKARGWSRLTSPKTTLHIGYDELRGVNFKPSGAIIKSKERSMLTSLQAKKDTFNFHGLHMDNEVADFIEEKVKESRKSPSSSENQLSGSVVDELERLQELHENGVLSDEEFKKAKDEVIGK